MEEHKAHKENNRMIARTRRRFLVIVGLIVALIIAAGAIAFLSRGPRPLSVIAFDVGQGDALFLETSHKKQMLIDGGPSSSVIEKLGRAMPFYDRTIDVVVLTHPDADHLTGLIEVVRRYHVGRLLLTGVKKETDTYQSFLAIVHEKKIPITYARAGDSLLLDDDTTFTILAPVESWEGRESAVVNDTGIVGRLDYQRFSVLFTADVGNDVEKQLLDSGAHIQADVLKIGHHGSKTSTSKAFLNAVAPELAVVSVGANNRYGHPHPDVMARLEQDAVFVLRTDQDGDIRIESFGDAFKTKQGIGLHLW